MSDIPVFPLSAKREALWIFLGQYLFDLNQIACKEVGLSGPKTYLCCFGLDRGQSLCDRDAGKMVFFTPS